MPPCFRLRRTDLSRVSLYNNEQWLPKTDISLLVGLVPPPRPMPNPLFDQLARPVVGPLPMSTVDALINGSPRLPGVIIAKVVNLEGIPIPGARVKISTPGVGTDQESIADAKGFAFLPSYGDKVPNLFVFTGSVFGADDSLSFSSSYLTNLYARGNTKAVSFELALNLPLLQIQRDANLVIGKPASDSKNSFPAQLLSLTDGKSESIFKLEPGAWAEVDLGRDRLLGQFSWETQNKVAFEIYVYGTSEKIADAEKWYTFAPQGDLAVQTTAYPTPVTGRYLRIQNTGKETLLVKDLKVFAAKRN
jgi:hypothetical protein